MRTSVLLALLCIVGYASATFAPRNRHAPQFPGTGPHLPPPNIPKQFQMDFRHRFRREPSPQGSVVIQGTKPLSGPDRRPSLDVNYNHRLMDNGRSTLDAYGGVNIQPGSRAQPHAGFNYERQLGKNGFIGGGGQVQRGPSGRFTPTFGVNAGWRFKREAEPDFAEEIEEEEY